MTQDEYNRWWIDQGFEDDLPEPIATLAAHVVALQERIGQLPDNLKCACAYDHPADVCMAHDTRTTGRASQARTAPEAGTTEP